MNDTLNCSNYKVNFVTLMYYCYVTCHYNNARRFNPKIIVLKALNASHNVGSGCYTEVSTIQINPLHLFPLQEDKDVLLLSNL